MKIERRRLLSDASLRGAFREYRILAVSVGTAAQVTFAIHSADRGRGTLGIDETLVALAVVQIASGSRRSAVSARRTLRALRAGGLADRSALRRRAVLVRGATNARARSGVTERRIGPAARVRRASCGAFVIFRKAGLAGGAVRCRAALAAVAEDAGGLAGVSAIDIRRAFRTPERRGAPGRTLAAAHAANAGSVGRGASASKDEKCRDDEARGDEAANVH